MESFTEVTERVLQSNAKKLVEAKTPEAITNLAPDIAAQIRKEYKPQSDPFAYRAVIVILGIAVVVVAITYAWYTLTPDIEATATSPAQKLRDLPDALIALGSAAVGALAGILAPVPRN